MQREESNENTYLKKKKGKRKDKSKIENYFVKQNQCNKISRGVRTL